MIIAQIAVPYKSTTRIQLQGSPTISRKGNHQEVTLVEEAKPLSTVVANCEGMKEGLRDRYNLNKAVMGEIPRHHW